MISCDPNDLMAAAKCFRCIPKGMQREVQTYLICQWANNAGFPCGEPSEIIQITGAGTAAANQFYTWNAGLDEWVGVTTPGVTISLVGGVWTMILELQVLYTAIEFPCTWTTVGGNNPAPTGVYQPALPEVPENLTLPTIVGVVEVGADISGTDGTWEGSPTSFAYQWFADGAPIGGATSNTFLVTAAQVGKVITFQVIATNAGGDSLPAVSLGSAPVPDPSAAIVNSWAAQVVTNGGAAPSAGTKNALKTFVGALMTANIWSKMHIINCIVPDSVVAALTPLIKGTGNALWVDAGGMSTHLSVNGFEGGFGSDWAITGIKLTSEFSTNNNCGLSAYQEDVNFQGTVLGSDIAQVGSFWLKGGNANSSWYAFDAANPLTVNNALGAGGWGFVSCSRVSSSDQQIYSARSNVAWASRGTYAGSPATRPPDVAIVLFLAVPNANFQYAGHVSFISLHDGLSSAEGQAFFNAVQALRVAFGGGYG